MRRPANLKRVWLPAAILHLRMRNHDFGAIRGPRLHFANLFESARRSVLSPRFFVLFFCSLFVFCFCFSLVVASRLPVATGNAPPDSWPAEPSGRSEQPSRGDPTG